MRKKCDFRNVFCTLQEVRGEVALLKKALGIELGDIQTGYEEVIEDLLKLQGYSEKQIDLIWELTEPEEN